MFSKKFQKLNFHFYFNLLFFLVNKFRCPPAFFAFLYFEAYELWKIWRCKEFNFSVKSNFLWRFVVLNGLDKLSLLVYYRVHHENWKSTTNESWSCETLIKGYWMKLDSNITLILRIRVTRKFERRIIFWLKMLGNSWVVWVLFRNLC